MTDPLIEIEDRLKENFLQYTDPKLPSFDMDQFYQAMVDIENLLNLIDVYEDQLAIRMNLPTHETEKYFNEIKKQIFGGK